MRKICKKIKLSKKVYLYLFSIFLWVYFLCLIYFLHINRKLINNINHYYVFSQVNNHLDENLIDNELIDMISDNSITKFVNNKVSFNNLSYIPKDLVSISSKYVLDIKWNSRLRTEANLALQNLAWDFYSHFWEKIVIVSAYRSYQYQVWIKAGWCSDLFCSKAWFSEHQTWLALDFWEASSETSFLKNKKLFQYFNWMKKNAYKYWFNNSYQKWYEIDGYNVEPWHWRYLWISLAQELFDSNQTFSQFYHIKN